MIDDAFASARRLATALEQLLALEAVQDGIDAPFAERQRPPSPARCNDCTSSYPCIGRRLKSCRTSNSGTPLRKSGFVRFALIGSSQNVPRRRSDGDGTIPGTTRQHHINRRPKSES